MKIRERRALRRAAKFIAGFEGGRSSDGRFHVYWDSAGRVYTIGYGHTGPEVHARMASWSKRQALRQLRKDARYALQSVEANAGRIKLRPNELAALTSFGFNLGTGYFSRGHTMGEALHVGNRMAIANAFLPYDMAGGQRLAGLTRRRHAERRLFLSH